MDLYALYKRSWWETQCFYHALAALGREGLILCFPDRPYICLGIHDDGKAEIDAVFCAGGGLPLIRRKIGGGVVYLDESQFFYQVVLGRDHPLIPAGRREAFFERMLTPAMNVLSRRFFMEVSRGSPADLLCDGGKCVGSGVGEIGAAVAFAGNILLDFRPRVMAGALRSPHPAFTGLLAEAMTANIRTVRSYTRGELPPAELLTDWFCEEFETVLGDLRPRSPDEELEAKALELKEELTASAWLWKKGRRTAHRRVKIREGVYLSCHEKNGRLYALESESGTVTKAYRLDGGGAAALACPERVTPEQWLEEIR